MTREGDTSRLRARLLKVTQPLVRESLSVHYVIPSLSRARDNHSHHQGNAAQLSYDDWGGFTSDIEQRWAQHRCGEYKTCYTFMRRPLVLKLLANKAASDTAGNDDWGGPSTSSG